jgi:hypothetical protein
MTKQLLTLLFLVYSLHSYAQGEKTNPSDKKMRQGLFLGTNTSRTIFHFLASAGNGYNFDLDAKYRLNKFLIGGTFGVSRYFATRKNIKNRFIQGYYYELGAEFSPTADSNEFQDISIGLHYLRAEARETGTFHKSNSFGDYNQNYSRTMWLEGIRLSINGWARFSDNFWLVVSPKAIYCTAPDRSPYNTYPFDVPLGYMSGVGIKFLSTNEGEAWLTLGLDLKLVLKFKTSNP